LALFILGVCTGLASAQNNVKANQKGNGNKGSVRNVDQEYTDSMVSGHGKNLWRQWY